MDKALKVKNKKCVATKKYDIRYNYMTMRFIRNLGVDVDGTLTKETIGKEIMHLKPKEINKILLNCTPKDGIDILFESDCFKFIITGRQEMYKETTTDWLDMYGVHYEDISMFPNDFYIINGYSISKYVNLKLNMHIEKNIHLAFDDNIDVVNCLNSSGIETHRVAGNFKDAYDKAFNNVLKKN